MKILLDTHTFLWLILDHPQLSNKAKKLFLNVENELFLSIASIWEIAIKSSLRKLVLKQPIARFIPEQLQYNNITQLDIHFRHVTTVATLAFHHRDPFDRLLISQALTENLLILSNDIAFDAYAIQRIW